MTASTVSPTLLYSTLEIFNTAAGTGVAVGGTGVEVGVGGTGVLVGVAVGGTGVLVGVGDGGTGLEVGVGGIGVLVGVGGRGVAVGGTGVLVGVGDGGTGVEVGVGGVGVLVGVSKTGVGVSVGREFEVLVGVAVATFTSTGASGPLMVGAGVGVAAGWEQATISNISDAASRAVTNNSALRGRSLVADMVIRRLLPNGMNRQLDMLKNSLMFCC